MLRIYKMPNGRKYRFDDADVPEGAVLVGPKPEEPAPKKKPAKKAAEKPNKAKKTSNKAKKAETK